MSVALSKKLSLAKEDVHKVCLSKGLDGQVFRVAVVIDVSGSTRGMFSSGLMQDVIERTVPVAMQFDDNGEMECWIFSGGSWIAKPFHRLPDITMDNLEAYAEEYILPKHGGGTDYAPVLKDVLKKYTSEDPSPVPTFVMFYTDGDNDDSDKPKTKKVIRELSKHNIFVQFIGIGDAQKYFLAEELNNLSDTYIDCCGFCDLTKINKMSNSDLYSEILNELPSWVQEAKKKGLI